jgi:hypothetical protein
LGRTCLPHLANVSAGWWLQAPQDLGFVCVNTLFPLHLDKGQLMVPPFATFAPQMKLAAWMPLAAIFFLVHLSPVIFSFALKQQAFTTIQVVWFGDGSWASVPSIQ